MFTSFSLPIKILGKIMHNMSPIFSYNSSCFSSSSNHHQLGTIVYMQKYQTTTSLGCQRIKSTYFTGWLLMELHLGHIFVMLWCYDWWSLRCIWRVFSLFFHSPYNWLSLNMKQKQHICNHNLQTNVRSSQRTTSQLYCPLCKMTEWTRFSLLDLLTRNTCPRETNVDLP